MSCQHPPEDFIVFREGDAIGVSCQGKGCGNHRTLYEMKDIYRQLKERLCKYGHDLALHRNKDHEVFAATCKECGQQFEVAMKPVDKTGGEQ